MAKIGIQSGKVLFHNDKVQFGCDCCCPDPEYRNLWPDDNDYRYQESGQSGGFWTQLDVRFCDTIKLYVSTDGMSTWVQTGEDGVGWNANGALYPTPGTDITYSDVWANSTRMMSAQSLSGLLAWFAEPYYAPSVLWWKYELSNSCGKTIETTPRRYEIILKNTPPPQITCNSCPRNSFKNTYVVNVAGTDGSYNYFKNLSPFTVTHALPLSSCNWWYGVGGVYPNAQLTWSVNRWIITFFVNASCWFRVFRAVGSPCNPTGVYVAGGGGTCGNATCSGGTTCPGSYTVVLS